MFVENAPANIHLQGFTSRYCIERLKHDRLRAQNLLGEYRAKLSCSGYKYRKLFLRTLKTCTQNTQYSTKLIPASM
jgi:hypothetical protein